ncbi:MAG: Histone transcription regulator 3 [Phylliscum demangeonii]|nr:MAG: Histone transcription regulator 3 [Phylliscum demangeonii]
MDKWETWWRLAQIFDSMIEEDVVWSANKLNNFRDGLNVLQRNAIHCYSLAVSISMQQTDPPSAEIAGKLFELFHDFGLRIYASSRPPFAMEVFSVNEFSRPFSGEDMYSGKPHLAVTEEIAWKFSAFLFGRALNYKKSHWHSHYMKAKCLWKMCCRGVANDEGPVYVQDVVESLQLAVRAVPKRRSDRQDPIIEPFYKLMSVVNKAVRGGKLSVTEGHRILEDNTPFTRGISPPGLPSQWDEFMELVLKALSAADKAGWHHRMAARLAHIKFETSAYAARHLLTPRILTKSMNLQIWKPDNERYASFCGLLFVCLLDLRGMESLAKRVRKKVSECYEHTKLWTEIFEGYIKILEGEARKEGVVLEDAVFKSITHEDFEAGADKLKEWSEGPTASHKLLDVLSSAMELKKLNASLAKAARLDSLLEHTFATLYGAVVPTLTAPEARTTPAIAATAGMDAVSAKKAADRRHKMSVDNLLLDVVPEDVGVESGRTEDGDPSEVVGPPGHSAAATRVAAGSRPRAKAITRREILRKAEMVVSSKAVAVAAVAAASRASGRSQGAVRAGGPALVHFSAPEDGDGDEDRDGDGDGDGDGDRDGRAQPRTWTRSPEKQPAGERRRRSNSQSDDAASGHATPPVAEDWQGSGAENGHGFLDAHDDQRRGAGAMDVDDDDDLPLDSFPQDHHLAAEEEDDIDQDEHELDEVLTEGMSIDGEDDDALDDEEEEEEEEDGGVRDVVPPAGVVMLTTPPFPQLPSMRTAPPVVRLPSMRTTSPPALRPNVPMTSPAALLPIPRLITISPLARLPRMRTTPPAVRREAEGDDVIMLDAHEE